MRGGIDDGSGVSWHIHQGVDQHNDYGDDDGWGQQANDVGDLVDIQQASC